MATIFWLKVLRVRPLLRLDRHLSSLLNNTYEQQTVRRNQNILRYSIHVPNKNKKQDNVSKEQVNTVSESKITLLLPNNSVTITYLEDAKKLAKRRKLILTKVEDEQKNSSRDTYKLMSPGDKHLETNDNNNKNEKIKTMKQMQISGKITIHDLNIKLKNINKLLSKNYKIKFIINHDSEAYVCYSLLHIDECVCLFINLFYFNLQDRILKHAESNIKQYGTIQKSVKSLYTKLIITPILNKNSNKNQHDANVNIKNNDQ